MISFRTQSCPADKSLGLGEEINVLFVVLPLTYCSSSICSFTSQSLHWRYHKSGPPVKRDLSALGGCKSSSAYLNSSVVLPTCHSRKCWGCAYMFVVSKGKANFRPQEFNCVLFKKHIGWWGAGVLFGCCHLTSLAHESCLVWKVTFMLIHLTHFVFTANFLLRLFLSLWKS